MIAIANYFAFVIVFLISVFFFRNKYFLTEASKYYRICISLTPVGAIINSLTTVSTLPLWLSKTLFVSDALLSYLITVTLAFYLTLKVNEHNFSRRSLLLNKILLLSVLSVFTVFTLVSIPFDWIFAYNEAGQHVNGPLFIFPHLIFFPEAVIVLISYFVHKKGLRKSTSVALLLSAAMLFLVFIAKTIYKDVRFTLLAVALIELAFYVGFQQHRMGVNSITRLNDRRSFFIEINKRIKQNTPFKAYLIKLNNLNALKQNHEHKMIDELLYQFAFSLEKTFASDSVFHMHSTTFAIITSAENGSEFTSRLLEYLSVGITCQEKNYQLEYTVSEHTWKKENETNADTFYEKLEYAQIIAKENKQQHIVYTLGIEVERLRKKYLINRMQKISTEQGFEIWFQPIYSLRKKSFSSMEVLLRLKESNGSFISPAEFIPLAEKTGQIVPITWFVIEETCKALSQTPEISGMRASVNLPMIQLIDPTFEEKLNAIVDGYGVPHNMISFEFTERVILDDLAVAEKNMRRLAAQGYTFYLDDFGVGYSNFNCILSLPLRTVKLDISLTSTAEKLKKNYGLVNVLTDLFHDMGIHVVAEGAETAEQVELLHAYGVDNIQGYYYAKPMPLDKLCEFLENFEKRTEKEKAIT